MATLLIKNATIVTQDAGRRIIKNGAVAVEKDMVVAIGESNKIDSQYGSSDEVIDARGRVLMPGLINGHTHMFQSLLRGLGDDMALIEWLSKMLFPICEHLRPEHVRAAALLGCIEMIRSGVTTVVDNHHFSTDEKSIELIAGAALKTGIRCIIARGMRQRSRRSTLWQIPDYFFPYSLEEELSITDRLIRRWNGRGSGISVIPAPVAIFVCTPELFLGAKELSDRYNVPIHTHVSETRAEVEAVTEDYGRPPVEFLADLGVLESNFQAVHGVWLNNNEIELMAKKGASHIYCPVSNMYLASGVAPVSALMARRVNIALGTDGPASNNNHDMFEAMKTAVLLQKVSSLDPRCVTSQHALDMATVNGAAAIGRGAEIGSIEVGKKADLVVVNIRRPHTAPVHSPVSSIVYCAHSDCVDTVIVNGKIVMNERKLLALDEEKAISLAEQAAYELAPASHTS